ncbi:hypothetical protein FEM48_Zijuj01G0325900 [Ziziphus jujuba var. spinosa]|uniref:Wall-associated receptor kinase 2-like n=1 Tax=Ziziphus jujuba var. spinosa TaxID=714518 RepID=A0A978W6K6_ZIZJJ|nr:hypothetical protein FEM48_Zijuj01G0325900 [Ziziphus jujuba var. spinosa]
MSVEAFSFDNHENVSWLKKISLISLFYIANFTEELLPLVLEWDIDSDTCEGNAASYADPSGYICKCNNRYAGNPYMLHGCQDEKCEMKKKGVILAGQKIKSL